MIRLRNFWFQLHKWLGITLAILVIPISLSGSALVWHDWLDEQINPQRYRAAPAPMLAPSAYAESALRLAKPGERISSLNFPGERGTVQAVLTKPSPGGGRPSRATVYLDPATAAPIERAGSGDGILRLLHVLHGSLMVPGVGRQVVGWVGVAMLISSLTGIWLWWPLKGSIRRGLRWNRRPDFNSNLHFQAGFWISVPLAVLSATGVWISFPTVFSGAPGGPPGGGAQVIEQPRLTPQAAAAAAQPIAQGSLKSLGWPTDKKPEWTVTLKGKGATTEVKVQDADASAKLLPRKPETLARTMRRIHDGTGMPFAWQVIIFVGGILPAALAVTGVLMWLRMRRRRQKHRHGNLQAAEAAA